MFRRIAIRTKVGVTFYDLPENERPMAIIGHQLYRTDEALMKCDASSPEEFCLYDYDGICPYGVEMPPSPDETMAYIDIAKDANHRINGVKRSWPKWLNKRNVILGAVILFIAYWYFTHGGK